MNCVCIGKSPKSNEPMENYSWKAEKHKQRFQWFLGARVTEFGVQIEKGKNGLVEVWIFTNQP